MAIMARATGDSANRMERMNIQSIHEDLSEYSLKLLNAYSDNLSISRTFNEDSGFRVKLHTTVSGVFQSADGSNVLIEDQEQNVWTFDNRHDFDQLIRLLELVRDDAFPASESTQPCPNA